MRRIAILLFQSDTRCFGPKKIRCRQVRFAKAEVYAVRQRSFEELPDKGRLQTLQSTRQFEPGRFLYRHHFSLSSSSTASSNSSLISPTSTLNSPSACVFGSPVKTPPIVSISPITF